MLSAIEIYNKPNFNYREETFAILAINSWELLFKAKLLRVSKYNMKSLYQLEFIKKKNGENSTRKKPKTNRSGNPTTIGIFEAIKRLDEKNYKLHDNLKSSLEALIELRDNAIHFHNEKIITKELQELGFACIKNYMKLIKVWQLEINLSDYNFYLMPLAYVNSHIDAEGLLTDEVANYVNFVKNKVSGSDIDDYEYDVAIGIDVQFKKTNTFDALGFKYDKNGVPIKMSLDEIMERYPLKYNDIWKKASERYLDFKCNNDFHKLMKEIKANEKLCYERKHDPSSEKTNKTKFYSSNIWQELDKN